MTIPDIFMNNPYFPQYVELVILLVGMFGLSFVVPSLRSLRTAAGVSLIFLPIVYFFALLVTYVSPVPFTDDYNLFETISKLHRAQDLASFCSALFEQVNQHRFAFERLVMLAMYYSTGTVSVPVLVFIGNLFMLGVLLLIYLIFKSERIHWHYFIPVPYMLFNLVYSENAYWGIAAIQNTPLIFMAFLSVYGLSRSGRGGWFLGFFAALVTTFISGSGLLTWIIGALFLAFKRKYKRLVVWVMLTIAVVIFYFTYDYTIIQSDNESVLRHPFYNLLLLWGFWGNALYLNVPHPLVNYFHADMVWCAVLGFVFTIILLFWLLRIVTMPKLTWTFWFLLGAAMFIMGTGAMFVISRPSGGFFMYGGAIFSRRYMIFGVVLLALMYTCVLVMLKKSPRGLLVSGVLSFLGVISLHFCSYYLTLVDLRQSYESLALDGYYWREYNTFLTQGDKYGDVPFWNHPTRMKQLMEAISEDGISKVNVAPSAENFLNFAKHNTAQRPFLGEFKVRSEVRTDWTNLASDFLTLEASPLGAEQVKYFVLKDSTHTLLLPAVPKPLDWWSMFLQNRYYSDTYQYGLYRMKLPASNRSYAVWLVTNDDQYWNTNKSLNIH
ncbi:hypothetical protein [Dyadobacter jejuensis]|nr:hypothetical protein [Dyadobacter jejuensis]